MDIYSRSYNIGQKSVAFDKQSTRKPFADSEQLNDQRFENINFNPVCFSKTNKVVSLRFDTQVARDIKKTFFTAKAHQGEYDSHLVKEKLITNLSKGIP